MGNRMTEQKFYTPLKVGLFIVVLSYFLFTLHATFTLSWIGEWERMGGNSSFAFMIFVEDISGAIGLVFRFAASIIALAAISYYFAKKTFSKPAVYNILKVILVFEAIYWFGLITTGIYSVQGALSGFGDGSLQSILATLATNVIPELVESLVLPISLLILAYKLKPSKPFKEQVKWGFISGTILVAMFWLVNTSIWIATERQKGMEYLAYPQNLLSIALTTVGLLTLTIYSAYVTAKYAKTETLQELNLRPIGVITTGLGLFFLWNYLTWIFVGGDYLWSSWFAWFLGHNLDLWMLSLPLLGLPMLFSGDR
jgi:hypothetical protein